jgi:porin
LFNGVLDIQGGRTELGQVAFQDPIYCEFQTNSICGEPPIMGKDTNASFYPVPVWGAWATVTPAKDFYALTGVFDNDPGESQAAHQSFDFGLDQSAGAQIPVEAGYQTTFDDDAYPRRYDIGAIFDQSAYTHPEFDTTTASLDSVGARDRSLVYFQAKQMVFRPNMQSQRGLTVFAAVAYGPDNTQAVDYSLSAGAVYQGVFESRPKDTLGIVVTDTHYRSNFITELYDYRVAALGGTQRPADDMVMTEINYDFFATPWFDVMPNLQYIVNPDGLGSESYPRSNLNDAFVVGVQVHINLAALAGLPSGN